MSLRTVGVGMCRATPISSCVEPEDQSARTLSWRSVSPSSRRGVQYTITSYRAPSTRRGTRYQRPTAQPLQDADDEGNQNGHADPEQESSGALDLGDGYVATRALMTASGRCATEAVGEVLGDHESDYIRISSEPRGLWPSARTSTQEMYTGGRAKRARSEGRRSEADQRCSLSQESLLLPLPLRV